MTSSPETPSDAHAYGAGRTARPLFALIPLGIAMAVALAMLAEGLHVMVTPYDSSAGVDSPVQTASTVTPSTRS